ncbi:hypothetical protein PM082_024849 [Marasmius tenuissimus]|nr:hypothetical protein PM082_024849 [Marasmius tenuissimus]
MGAVGPSNSEVGPSYLEGTPFSQPQQQYESHHLAKLIRKFHSLSPWSDQHGFGPHGVMEPQRCVHHSPPPSPPCSASVSLAYVEQYLKEKEEKV